MIQQRLKNKIKDKEVADLLFAIELASTGYVSQLKSARRVREDPVPSITVTELRSRKRIQEFVFSRMIFSVICRQQHYTIQAIADYLGLKSHACICKYLKNFQWDVRYVSGFRAYYMEVSRILKGIQAQREVKQETITETQTQTQTQTQPIPNN